MNYFSHLHVARRAGWEDPGHGLGAMLPDLASVARVRADPSLLPPDVAGGRDLHYRTDAAFHRSQSFLDLVAELRRPLKAARLPDGPGRAVAHLGTELLLDGLLPAPAALTHAFRTALARSTLVEPALARTDRGRWCEAVRWLSAADPTDYAEPAEVARRVHRVLERRVRLSFDQAHVPDVAVALVAHRPLVAREAENLLAEVTRAIG